MKPHLAPHYHRTRMPHCAAAYALARLLDRHGLRRIGLLGLVL